MLVFIKLAQRWELLIAVEVVNGAVLGCHFSHRRPPKRIVRIAKRHLKLLASVYRFRLCPLVWFFQHTRHISDGDEASPLTGLGNRELVG